VSAAAALRHIFPQVAVENARCGVLDSGIEPAGDHAGADVSLELQTVAVHQEKDIGRHGIVDGRAKHPALPGFDGDDCRELVRTDGLIDIVDENDRIALAQDGEETLVELFLGFSLRDRGDGSARCNYRDDIGEQGLARTHIGCIEGMDRRRANALAADRGQDGRQRHRPRRAGGAEICLLAVRDERKILNRVLEQRQRGESICARRLVWNFGESHAAGIKVDAGRRVISVIDED